MSVVVRIWILFDTFAGDENPILADPIASGENSRMIFYRRTKQRYIRRYYNIGYYYTFGFIQFIYIEENSIRRLPR